MRERLGALGISYIFVNINEPILTSDIKPTPTLLPSIVTAPDAFTSSIAVPDVQPPQTGTPVANPVVLPDLQDQFLAERLGRV